MNKNEAKPAIKLQASRIDSVVVLHRNACGIGVAIVYGGNFGNCNADNIGILVFIRLVRILQGGVFYESDCMENAENVGRDNENGFQNMVEKKQVF